MLQLNDPCVAGWGRCDLISKYFADLLSIVTFAIYVVIGIMMYL